MWFTAQANGYRGWFIVKDNEGNLRTGLAAGDFTVTVIEPNDGDSNNPSVSESGELPGTYYFDISSAFLIANGNGQYNVTVAVDTFGVSGPPNVRDVINSVLQVSSYDFNDIGNNTSDILEHVEYLRYDAVYISALYGSPGTGVDVGTRGNPSSNIADATTIAGMWGTRKFIFLDTQTYTLTQTYNNFVFEGESWATLNLNNQNVAGSQFSRLVVVGQGTPTSMVECYITSATIATFTFRCIFAGLVTVNANSIFNQSYFADCTMTITGGSVSIMGAYGELTYTNLNTGTHRLRGFRGNLGLAVSCTGGAVVLEGCDGLLVDGSNGTTVDSEGFNDTRARIAARGKVVAGGDDTDIYTDLDTYVDGFFDNMKFVVVNTTGIVARDILNYNQSNGEFTVDQLPYTPAAGDVVFILSEMSFSANDLAQAILNSNVPTGADGTLGNILGRMYAVTTTAQVGSTPTSIKTTLAQADDYFNDMQVLVNNISGSGGPVVRNITQYNQTNGEIIVDALPFTPDVGVQVLILSQVASGGSGGVWTVTEKNQVLADTAFTKEFTAGKWHILNNQMIFYKSDGTELIRFNLFNEDGTPAMEDIFKRVPV